MWNMTAKGRVPKRRKAVLKGEQIHIRVTTDQKATLVEASASAGLGVSSWMLSVALREAKRSEGGGGK
jgi:uncharacterized protein (DUF1778 family)